MEYSVTLGFIDEKDIPVNKKKVEDNHEILDIYINESSEKPFFLLTHQMDEKELEKKLNITSTSFNLKIYERPTEELIGFTCIEDTDYSKILTRIFSDPYHTTTLLSNPRISKGFIFESEQGEIYHTPEDLHKLLADINDGKKINKIYKRTGEQAAIADNNFMLARVTEFYPTQQEIIKSFKTIRTSKNSIHPIPIGLHHGRITIDNLYKPKNMAIRKEYL